MSKKFYNIIAGDCIFAGVSEDKLQDRLSRLGEQYSQKEIRYHLARDFAKVIEEGGLEKI